MFPTPGTSWIFMVLLSPCARASTDGRPKATQQKTAASNFPVIRVSLRPAPIKGAQCFFGRLAQVGFDCQALSAASAV